MFAPLRTLMIVLWVSSVAGGAVIVFLSLGWMNWIAFGLAGLIGLALGIPAGLWSARAIKREDPSWPPKRRRRQRKAKS